MDTIIVDNIPYEMKKLSQWVVRQGKIPLNPNAVYSESVRQFALVNDSSTWSDIDTAIYCCQKYALDGIGFVFASGQPYVGIDLDTCFDPVSKQFSDSAQAIIDMLDSYTEFSPSMYGVHIIIRCRSEITLPFNKMPMKENGIMRYDSNHKRKVPEIEIYNEKRYFTVTGNVVNSHISIEDRSDALDELLARYANCKRKTERTLHSNMEMPRTFQLTPSLSSELSDNELLAKAYASKNGYLFRNLYSGNKSGFKSHSEADQTLCNMLAFWCSGDVFQMDRLFRQSGLYRKKWDELHGEMTYGERTIYNAVSSAHSFYDPNFRRERE